MYKNLIEYQKAYFSKLFDLTEVDFGYFTASDDLEYINSNSTIVTEVTDDAVASVCALLATNLHTTKIQFPREVVNFGDEDDVLYLIEYSNQQRELVSGVSFELVTEENYQQFKQVSSRLQCQEYGEEYKPLTNERYLNQDDYQMYLVKYNGEYVGEFIYINELKAVESIIIASAYQRRGIATTILELMSASFGPVYLSADTSSIKFYKQINGKVIDVYPVKNLYGNSRNLLMYISLCI